MSSKIKQLAGKILDAGIVLVDASIKGVSIVDSGMNSTLNVVKSAEVYTEVLLTDAQYAATRAKQKQVERQAKLERKAARKIARAKAVQAEIDASTSQA